MLLCGCILSGEKQPSQPFPVRDMQTHLSKSTALYTLKVHHEQKTVITFKLAELKKNRTIDSNLILFLDYETLCVVCKEFTKPVVCCKGAVGDLRVICGSLLCFGQSWAGTTFA